MHEHEHEPADVSNLGSAPRLRVARQIGEEEKVGQMP
jgi:hypothetical protein